MDKKVLIVEDDEFLQELAATKLMKAGFRANGIDPNARHKPSKSLTLGICLIVYSSIL